MGIEALALERTQLFRDVFQGKVPARVPFSCPISLDVAIRYAGFDLQDTLWNTEKLEKVYEIACEDFISDTFPVGGHVRSPLFLQLTGSIANIMGSGGTLQHPDVEGLLSEEYDEFIASPYDCIVEKVIPRLYTELNTEPDIKALRLAKAMRADFDEAAKISAIKQRVSAKYGYSSIPRPQSSGFTEAPFDFLADYLRSFKGISVDIRRCPEKVVAACEAVMPLLIIKGLPPVPSREGYTGIPLHMAPFMREKDFEKFYWPTFKKMVDTLAEAGQPASLFVEHDWTRYLDYLYDLPENTIMRIEYGDPKVFKQKLGKKHILNGFYPATLLYTGSKEQCLDKAKELLDILAPGGKYFFTTDKSVLSMDSEGVLIRNVQAVLEYFYLNGKYERDSSQSNHSDNAQNDPLIKKTVAAKLSVNSKYFTTWDKYQQEHPELVGKPVQSIAPKIQKYEEFMLSYFLNLLM